MVQHLVTVSDIILWDTSVFAHGGCPLLQIQFGRAVWWTWWRWTMVFLAVVSWYLFLFQVKIKLKPWNSKYPSLFGVTVRSLFLTAHKISLFVIVFLCLAVLSLTGCEMRKAVDFELWYLNETKLNIEVGSGMCWQYTF